MIVDEGGRVRCEAGHPELHVVAALGDVLLDEFPVDRRRPPVCHGAGNLGVVLIVNRWHERQLGDRGKGLQKMVAQRLGGRGNLAGRVEVSAEGGEPGCEVEVRRPRVAGALQQGAVQGVGLGSLERHPR